MGIDLTGLTHVGDVITAQTSMQLNAAMLVDLSDPLTQIKSEFSPSRCEVLTEKTFIYFCSMLLRCNRHDVASRLRALGTTMGG